MNVLPKDNKTELKVLNLVKDHIKDFQGITFVQSEDKTAIFDFKGYIGNDLVCRVDVKVRENFSTEYPTSIFSLDKKQQFESEKNLLRHYLIIGYRGDWKIIVFDLKKSVITERKIHYKHRRTGADMETTICSLENKSRIFEAYITS